MKKQGKRQLWRGLCAVMASLLVLSLAVSPVVNQFRTDIDKFLGTSSTKMITDKTLESENLYTYVSDYGSTTELVQAIADLGTRMSAEGSVLLKNNGALPLSEEEKGRVSLLGFASYFPTMGGDMGSLLTPNVGTDADTVDFVQALEARGFTLNPAAKALYGNENAYSEWTGKAPKLSKLQAPLQSAVYVNKEPSAVALDAADADWRESLEEYPVCIVTLSRSGAENRSYYPGEAGLDPEQTLNQTDPLGLSDNERAIIHIATDAKEAYGGKVVVILNNASAMEIEEIKQNDGVDAILQIGFPGGYGFYGVADILTGAVCPSGHLTDTYAVKNAAAPSAQNYGIYEYTNANPDLQINSVIVEAEQIYTGYKYYETRYMDAALGQGNADSSVGSATGEGWDYDSEVSYPFGFGLSYTSFEQTLDSLKVDLKAKTATATVTVTNTGDVPGKDVVQLYVSTPYTDYDREHGVEKAGVQLLDYAKTGEIAPGGSETVTIVADLQYMASWDATADNAAGTLGCYILDAGDYIFALGNGAHEAANNTLTALGVRTDGDTARTAKWTLSELDTTSFACTKNGTPVENRLQDLDLNYWMPGTVTWLTRNDWAGTFPKTYRDLTATPDMLEVLDNDLVEISDNGSADSVTLGADNGLSLADLKGNISFDDPLWDLLLDQLSLDEAMYRAAFGGVSTKAMASLRSPEAVQNDGPNGIYSYPLGQYANREPSSGDPCAVADDDPNLGYMAGVMANPTVVAQTFSKELSREFGELMGNYSLWANLPIWWGCGVNLHRSPYNARNHEYYSEDAVLSAFQGAELVRGGLKYGLLVAPKHFAFNDTEINRIGVSMFLTEQAARENELRATQSAIEDAGALAVMTAFNRAGVTADNAHTGLLVGVLRQEWGFKGLISEDAIPWTGYTVLKEAVMNGVTMTTKTGTDSMEELAKKWPFWTEENLQRDATLRAALKQCMKYQAFALANSNAMDGLSSSSRMVRVRTWYDNLLTALQIAFASLFAAALAVYLRSRKTCPDADSGKDSGAGKIFLILSVLLTLAALTAYLINCRTAYFASLGVLAAPVTCLILAVAAQILAAVCARKGWKLWQDGLLVLAPCLLTAALVQLVGARVNEAASILTFQKTAANLKNLNSAFAAIGFTLLSVFSSWLSVLV